MLRARGYLGELVSRNRRVYTFGPGMDAAGDIGDGLVTLGAKILGYPQTAPAMVAMDEQMFVLRQSPDVFGDLTHRDKLGPGDAGGFRFEGLANVYKKDVARLFGEQAAGVFDGDFQRVCVGWV